MPITTTSSVPLATADQLRASAQRARRVSHLKGRQVDAQALAELRALIGSVPPGEGQ